MGSIRIAGVLFVVYSRDHPPRHVHGFYGGVAVIVELLPGGARVAGRHDAVEPKNAKRSDVAHIVSLAAQHHRELVAMWKAIHGLD